MAGRRSFVALFLVVPLSASEAAGWIVDPPADRSRPVMVRLWPAAMPERPALVVTAVGGRSLRSRVIDAQPGEPLLAMVEPTAPGPWSAEVRSGGDGSNPYEPRAGVVLEARTRPKGDLATVDGVRDLWQRGAVQGRTVVESIFLGVNPCGPSVDCCLRFDGWLRIPAAGSWTLATVSRDASVVEVDGRVACSWTGSHGPERGLRGEHGATLDLSAGEHRVTYLLAATSEVLAELAWKGPGVPTLQPVPAAAFVPPSSATVRSVGDRPWFSWSIAGHHDPVEGPLVEVLLHAQGGSAPWRWSFDDGLEAEGQEVRHLFVRPGMHRVTLSSGAATCAAMVAVHPRWEWSERWSDNDLDTRYRQLATRDGSAADAETLARNALHVATWAEDEAARLPVVRRWSGRLGQRNDLAAQPALRQALLALGHAAVALGGPAEVYAQVQDLGAAGDPEASRAALAHGAWLVSEQDRAGDGARALAAVRPAVLTADERRNWTMLRGDAAAVGGDVAAARKLYAEAGERIAASDRMAAMRRRTRIEQARDRLAMGQRDAAQRLLWDVEWDSPAERLGADTGLLTARAALDEGRPLAAVSRLRLVLAAVPIDDRRAEALALLARACRTLGRNDEAATAVATLRRDHPYSEAASRAAP